MNMLSGLDILFVNLHILSNIYTLQLFIIYIICLPQNIFLKNQPGSGSLFTTEWLNTNEQIYLRLDDHEYSNKGDCQRYHVLYRTEDRCRCISMKSYSLP